MQTCRRALVIAAVLGLLAPMASRSLAEVLDLAALARKARPAVCLIVVYDRAGREISTGTGFVISPDGILVTNHHVVRNAARAVAKFEDGRTLQMDKVLASDKTNDVAIVRLRGRDLPFLNLGNTAQIEAGHRVAVIGSPLGLEGTLTEGIVSAVRGIYNWKRCLQISAAISPGSSGSPVLDKSGDVIGIATFLLKEGHSLNFAVPAEIAAGLIARHSLVAGAGATVPRPRATHPPASADTGGARRQTAVATADMVRDEPDTSGVTSDDRQDAWEHQAIVDSEEMNLLLAADAAGDRQSVLDAARALVARFPASPMAHVELGLACYDFRLADETIQACRRAIELRPDYSPAWQMLAIEYAASGRMNEAWETIGHLHMIDHELALKVSSSIVRSAAAPTP